MMPLCREAREVTCAVGAQISRIKVVQDSIAKQRGYMRRGGHEQIVKYDIDLAFGAAGADLVVAMGDVAGPISNSFVAVEGLEGRIEACNHSFGYNLLKVFWRANPRLNPLLS